MTTTKSAAKPRKPAKGSTFNLTVVADMPSAMGESVILANLLDDLQNEDGAETTELTGATFDTGGEVIESSADAAGDLDLGDLMTDLDLTDLTDLADAVADAENTSAKHAVYAAQSSAPTDDGSAPSAPAVAAALTKDEKKAAKAAEAAIKKAEKAAAKVAADAVKAAAKELVDAAPAKPKPPAVPRATSITHKPGDLLVVKLGSAARDYLSFSLSAIATLEPEVLEAEQDDFIARMNDRDSIADKVKEKMTMLLCWLQKGGDLNEVLKRTFTVLHDKAELTSGDKGNLQLNLLSKPYSMGTARSQANQMFMALPELGIVIKEKGRMVGNPDSVLLPMINAKLRLV